MVSTWHDNGHGHIAWKEKGKKDIGKRAWSLVVLLSYPPLFADCLFPSPSLFVILYDIPT
jgi:hypothetical protein